MTTIAYRDGVLVSDSLLSGGNLRCGSVEKVARSGAGHLGGMAGDAGEAAKFLAWIKGGCEGDMPSLEGEIDGILVEPDGRIFAVAQRGGRYQVTAPFYAVGSGERMALAAMEMGADPQKAVEVAIKFDQLSGGDLQVLEL